jgi:hypothetical protein
MPVPHIFKQQLQLTELSYQPTTLIVGTFSPLMPGHNHAQWFYDRTEQNYFWEILPQLYGEQSLLYAGPQQWQQFCQSHGIALTDLITSIDDADLKKSEHHKILGGYSDKAIIHHFDDFTFTDIVGILRQHPTIRHVYLTRGITEAFWRHLWSPVMRHCHTHTIHERRLISPTPSAAYQHTQHNDENPSHTIPTLSQYLLYRWQQEWHPI